MKEIQLTQGLFAQVDDEDFEWLNQWKWCADIGRNNTYAIRGVWNGVGKPQGTKRMHVEITGEKLTDHADRNGLNNQRHNLRPCTCGQNNHNKRTSEKATSKYIGVSWSNEKGKWHVQIKVNKKSVYLGRFYDEIEAAKAYDKKAIEVFGDFANTNFK